MRANGHLVRLSGFAAASIVSAVVPLFVLPVVARVGGPNEWAALGLGQSIGAFVALIVSWGWGILGPVAVARADHADREELLRNAHSSRLMLFVVSVPIVFGVSWFVAPTGHLGFTVLAAVGTALGGFTHYWYAIGAKSPRIFILFEIVPRVGLILGSIPLILATRQIFYYPAALIVSGLVSFIAFSTITRTFPTSRVHLVNGFSVLRAHKNAAATTLAVGSYTMLPIVVMGFVTPPLGLVPFVSADRLYKMCIPVVTTLNSTLQGWVSEQISSQITIRMKRALNLHLCLGVIGGVGIAVAGPAITSILFGAELSTTWPIAVCYGVAFIALAANESLGNQILVPLEKIKSVLVSTILGASTGLITIAIAGKVYGAIGGAVGVASGELVVLLAQLVFVLRLWRAPHRIVSSGG